MSEIRRSSLGSLPRSFVALMAAVLLLALFPFAGTAVAFEGEIEVEERDGQIPSFRFAGEDRFETAGLIATDDTRLAARFETGTVLVARADLFPDALAGSVLGGLFRAPIVLSPNNTDDDEGNLNEDTEEALRELDPETITILGGTEAIEEDVEEELEETFPDADIERIGGEDRFQTAALIADELPNEETDTAIVADGGDFADALVAGAIAASQQIPILLTFEDGDLHPATEERLRDNEYDEVIIAGGVDALSQDVEDQIEDIVGEGNTRRVAGNTRFETAVEFAREGTENFGFTNYHLNFATGLKFPDALALGPHAGLDYNGPAPILLTDLGELSDPTRDYLNEIDRCVETIHVAGGVEAIEDEVEDEARQILTQEGEACSLELSPETATNMVGETHTVVARVSDNTGNAAEGNGETLTVRFEVTPESSTASGSNETSTARPTPESATVQVNQNGFAEFTFTSDTAGCVVITASTRSTNFAATAEVSKCFVEGQGGARDPVDPGPGTPPMGNGPFNFDTDAQGFTVTRGTFGNPLSNWARGSGGANESMAFRTRLGLGLTAQGYGDFSDTRLTSPDLISLGGPQTLVFDLKNETEEGFDFVQVRVGTGAGTTTFGEPITEFSGEIAEFETMEVPLGNIPAGPFRVRFQFVSDEIVSTVPEGFSGAFVDNVSVVPG